MRKIYNNRKGVLDSLSNLIVGLGILGIILAIIFVLIAETQDVVLDQDPCSNTTHYYNASSGLCHVNSSDFGRTFSATYNATVDVQGAASDIPGWLPIVVVTVIGVTLLGLIRLLKR